MAFRLSFNCFELGKEVSLLMIYLYVQGRVKRRKTRARSDGTTLRGKLSACRFEGTEEHVKSVLAPN